MPHGKEKHMRTEVLKRAGGSGGAGRRMHGPARRAVAWPVLLLVAAVAMLAAGCAPRTAPWNPVSRELVLYYPTTVTVPQEYVPAGTLRVVVEGKGDVATIRPRDILETRVFTAEGAVLLAQRLVKTDRVYRFRYLGGVKSEQWGLEWRTAEYVLDTALPDREYEQYVLYLHSMGVVLPRMVKVRVLDRLASDFILLRMVTLEYEPVPQETLEAKGIGNVGDVGGKPAPAPAPVPAPATEDSAASQGTGYGHLKPVPPFSRMYDQELYHDNRRINGDSFFWF